MTRLGPVSFWVLLVLVIGSALAASLVSIWLAHRIRPEPASASHNQALSPFITIVGIVYGVLLGFTVVIAWQRFSTAEQDVANEASTLATMYRMTVALPDQEQKELRVYLWQYANEVIGPEWREQHNGGTSETARAAITRMYDYHHLRSEQPGFASSWVDEEFLKQLNQLARDRNNRTLDAEPRVPWLFWSGLIAGGLVLIMLTGLADIASIRVHLLLSCTVAGLLGLLLFIIYNLDHPYGSMIGVTTAEFEHSIAIFRAVDQGVG